MTTGSAEGFAIWVADMERSVLAPPQLDKTDIVGAFRDMEVRNRPVALGARRAVTKHRKVLIVYGGLNFLRLTDGEPADSIVTRLETSGVKVFRSGPRSLDLT